MKKVICAVAMMACAGAAFSQTMYKCGKTYQQTPCDADGTSAMVVRPAAAPEKKAVKDSAPATAEKKKTYPETLVEERIQREAWYARRDAENAYSSKLSSCRREQAAIESEMQYSNNNLAGATRDVSIAQKMEAAARVCSAEAESLARRLEAARTRCKEVKCDSVTIAH